MWEEQQYSYPSQFNCIWKMRQKYSYCEQILGCISQTNNCRCRSFYIDFFFLIRLLILLKIMNRNKCHPSHKIILATHQYHPIYGQGTMQQSRTESPLWKSRSQECSRTTVAWQTERRANQALKPAQAMDASNLPSPPSTQNLLRASPVKWVCK